MIFDLICPRGRGCRLKQELGMFGSVGNSCPQIPFERLWAQLSEQWLSPTTPCLGRIFWAQAKGECGRSWDLWLSYKWRKTGWKRGVMWREMKYGKKRKIFFSYWASLFSSQNPCLQITYFALLRNDTTFNLLIQENQRIPLATSMGFFFFCFCCEDSLVSITAASTWWKQIMGVLQFRREVINLYSPFSFLQMKVCRLVFNKHLHENRNFSLRSLSPAA